MWSLDKLKGVMGKEKKGVSELIAYVLIVAFAVIIAAIVFIWLRTYVPSETLNCPEGTSLFVSDVNYCGNLLDLVIKNNGRFDVAGYFIHATNSSSQETATVDLSQRLNESVSGKMFGNSVLFSTTGQNTLAPGDQAENIFSLPSAFGGIFSIDIIPTRFQEQDNRDRFVTCSAAHLIATNLICKGPITGCVPASNPNQTAICSGRQCGLVTNGTCGYVNCGQCGNNEFCDAGGTCRSTDCIPAADPTKEGICGTQQCGTSINSNNTCGRVDCGTCNPGFACVSGQCVAQCGDGSIQPGEDCDYGSGNGIICTPSYGGSCTYCSSGCQNVTINGSFCGDHIINFPQENCDNGTLLNGQICQPPTGGSCMYCNSTCQKVVNTYNNSVCDPGETCAEPACNGYQANCPQGSLCISGICQTLTGGIGCINYCVSLHKGYISSSCTANTGQCGSRGGTIEHGGDYICQLQSSGYPICCCFIH